MAPYTPPAPITQVPLASLLPPNRVVARGSGVSDSLLLYASGHSSLALRPAVSIVGSRKATLPALRLATLVSWSLCRAGIVILSGLAKGIDAAAHRAALSCYGDTIAIVGTGLDRAYPACNANLQSILATDHLVLSPFPLGATVRPGNFPYRNRLMAALSDATVIIQAADGSGALHQAAACQRLGRPLFLPRVLAEDASLSWPADYLGLPGVHVFDHPDEVLEALLAPRLAKAS